MPEIYLVTGSTGFLGSTLVKLLIKRGKQVIGLRLPHEREHLHEKATYVTGDITKPHTLQPFFSYAKDHDCILIHCAGAISIASASNATLQKTNVGGTKFLVELSLRHHIRRFIYVSSVHALREERQGRMIRESTDFSARHVEGAYAKSKAAATAYVLAAVPRGLDAVIVHPSGIIGPGDHPGSYMSEVIQRFLRGHFLMAIEGGYDFVDVRDVAKGILNAAYAGKSGETYILSNQYWSIRELFEALSRFRGKAKTYRTVPLKLIRPFARIIERIEKLLGVPLLITPYSLYALGSNGNFSHEKATAELNYKPRPVEQTLRSILHSTGKLIRRRKQ